MSYRDDVLRTWGQETHSKETLVNSALGLSGEAGEVADLLKKHLFHGHPLDTSKLVKELGDVRYYLEILANYIGVPMDEIEARNVAKLRQRYPEGFSVEKSLNRTE